MKNPTETPEQESLLNDALDWIVRLKAGEPTRADVEAFKLWRSQDPAHEEALKTAVRVWRNAGQAAQALAEEDVSGEGRSSSHGVQHHQMARRAFLGGGIAAAVAATYAAVEPPFGLWPSLQELSADFRTAKGERRKVDLTSGVSMELNTQTSVAMRPVSNEVEIELISGEASVAADRPTSSPLGMVAATGRITATRADFNVRCLDGIVSVACLGGAVDVEQGGKTVRVESGEQVTYSSAGIAQVHKIDVEQVVAWQSGLLIFRDRSLGRVVDEVNRYRPGKIIITNADMRSRVVNGTFQIDQLENFVAQVQQLFGARVTSLPGGVVLLS